MVCQSIGGQENLAAASSVVRKQATGEAVERQIDR
jgi:hypothetical protein